MWKWKDTYIVSTDCWSPARGPVTERNWVTVIIQKNDPIPWFLGAKISYAYDVSSVWEGTIGVRYQFPINIVGDVLRKLFIQRLKRVQEMQYRVVAKQGGASKLLWTYPFPYYPQKRQK